MKEFSIYPVSLVGHDIEIKREEIRDYFHNTYNLFEKIFSILKDDDVFYRQSETTRHPMIFYFGHTAAFFVNKLMLSKIIDNRINPKFESIFAVGVDEMAWDDMSLKEWPSVDEVRAYRDEVRKLVDSVIDTIEFRVPITQDSPMWVIMMAIEHERIHIETSSVLHRQMDIEYIKDDSFFNICDEFTEAPKNSMHAIKGGQVTLSKEKEHPLYGWDNEYGEDKEEVEDFLVSKYIVSNSEYMEFVEDGGYEDKSFWNEEGLEFLEDSRAKHPPFWHVEDGKYRYRALTKIIDMPLSWPVEVNALEAMAFCRYKSKKDGVVYTLPSEAEFRLLYEYAELEDIPELDDNYANINFNHFFSSCAVDKFMFKELGDVIGNVWQWSRTPIFGFDGFEVHPAYDDFSTPTFDNKHDIIHGGSWASSGNLIMKHSRYAFRRHFYQHAGFRYVISDTTNNIDEDIYESDELLSQYCEFQYGKDLLGVKNFAIACAKIATKYTDKKTKALDLGCATGRASFELAKTFDSVEGIDFSVRFIGVGTKLKTDGYIGWNKPVEGDLVLKSKITLKDLQYEEIAEKVEFWQGDACNLKPNFNSYDLVMATNLIDRLYQPKLFLEEIKNRINDGGILMITSPYTWQESSTAKEFWLGGYKDESGKEIKTIETLKEILIDDFELIHLEDLPFVIAESARKHQYTIAEVSVWRKKMIYNFTTSTNRKSSNAEKYQARKKLFGTTDVLPAWVADMDIETPLFVLDAVKKRLEHPITGYEYVPESLYEAQIDWMQKKYGMSLTKEMIYHSYSIVTLMNVAIEAFSDEGDGVIIQTPIYPPFSHFVKEYKRKIINNPLRLSDDGEYTFDIEDLRSKIDKNTKLLLLCSPHNPVGRVWKREELEAILEVCLEHNIVVFADEIHSDLVFAPHKHTPFATLNKQAASITVTAFGVGKTFNMAGFAMGSVAIIDENLRKRFLEVYNRIHLLQGNVLSHVAVEAAYREGDEWLEELKIHLNNNYKLLENLLEKYQHAIKLTPLEGTYLAWLDCRAMGLTDKKLREFFIKECRLGLSPGISFGREGSGFMRLNFAISSTIMSELLRRLEIGLKSIDQYE